MHANSKSVFQFWYERKYEVIRDVFTYPLFVPKRVGMGVRVGLILHIIILHIGHIFIIQAVVSEMRADCQNCSIWT